jgi:hypothetical protein
MLDGSLGQLAADRQACLSGPDDNYVHRHINSPTPSGAT